LKAFTSAATISFFFKGGRVVRLIIEPVQHLLYPVYRITPGIGHEVLKHHGLILLGHRRVCHFTLDHLIANASR